MPSWSYRGPKEPTRVKGCDVCAAAGAQQCLSKATLPHSGCVMCDAAKSGACSTHGLGAAGAMDAYECGLSEEAREDFAPVRVLIASRLSKMPPDAMVEITVREFEDPIPDPHGECVVAVNRLRGKAEWQHAI